MKCVLCSSTLTRAARHQGTVVGPLKQSAYKSPTGLYSYLQNQLRPQSYFTNPGLWVTEPSNPAQRHLGCVPRTATSSPHHARAQDASPDDHKHGAVLCALSHCSEMHCQTPSAVK